MKHDTKATSILVAALLFIAYGSAPGAAEEVKVRVVPTISVHGVLQCQPRNSDICTGEFGSPKVIAQVHRQIRRINGMDLELAKITDLVESASALEAKMYELEDRMRALIELERSALFDVSNHLVKRIDQVPMALVRDEKAIELLRERLANPGK